MYAASAVRAIQPGRIQIILSQRSRPREPFETKCQTMEKERNKCGGQQRESMSKLELISRCKSNRGLAVFWVLMSRAKHSLCQASEFSRGVRREHGCLLCEYKRTWSSHSPCYRAHIVCESLPTAYGSLTTLSHSEQKNARYWSDCCIELIIMHAFL